MNKPSATKQLAVNEKTFDVWQVGIYSETADLIVKPKYEYFDEEEIRMHAGKLVQVDQMYDQFPVAICVTVEDHNSYIDAVISQED